MIDEAVDSIDVNCDECGWTKRVKPSRRYIKNVGNKYHAYEKKAHEMIFNHANKMHKANGVKIKEHNPYDENPVIWGVDTSENEYVLDNREWCHIPHNFDV